jgi:hypothetical protein
MAPDTGAGGTFPFTALLVIACIEQRKDCAMNKRILMTMSAFALLTAAPVQAYSRPADAPPGAATAPAGKESLFDIHSREQAIFIDGRSAITGTAIDVDRRTTAQGIIGKPLYNEANKKIATIKDIIINGNGKASKVVAENGGFMGVGGKHVAFDYDTVIGRTPDGDMIQPLSQDKLGQGTPYSDNGKTGSTADYSVNKLLKGKLLDSQGHNAAEVVNLTFRDGSADKLIVAANRVLGLGGEKLALNYNELKVTPHGAKFDLQMDPSLTTEFNDYKNRKEMKTSKR